MILPRSGGFFDVASALDGHGIVLTGTHARCGKTVAAAGLGLALQSLGFGVEALKPLSFQPPVSIRGGYEQAYFERLLPFQQATQWIPRPSARAVTLTDWQGLLAYAQSRVSPYILETPAQLSSPIFWDSDGASLDAVHLANALALPLLLVTQKQPDLLGVLLPVWAWLQARGCLPLGWMAVETTPLVCPCWDADVLFLQQEMPMPFLGEIAYSPSISVEALQQGNLLRSTEMGVDLAPIQQGVNLLLPFP